MAEMRTEEEQVEALKQWWKENGKSLVLTVAVAVGGVFAWKGWQQKVHNEAEAASITYQNLLDAVAVSVGAADEAQAATSQHLAKELKSDYASSEYARFAALLMARVAIDQGDYDLALTELDWVLASAPNEEMKQVTLLRKARVHLAKGDADAGLAVLGNVNQKAFDASALELKGDLLVASDRKGEARQAYQQALDMTNGENPLLTMKFEDLAAFGDS